MTCLSALLLIDDYVDENLSAEEVERLENHLESCSRCRKEFQTTQRLKQLLRQTPKHDPGRDYWSETTRLIRARTIDSPFNDRQVLNLTSDTMGIRHNALVRAVVSVAASLFVLVSAIIIGTSQDQQISRMDAVNVPILATAPVSELLGADRSPIVTQDEQVRLAKGMLLMGAPGFLGRFTGLPDLTTSGE